MQVSGLLQQLAPTPSLSPALERQAGTLQGSDVQNRQGCDVQTRLTIQDLVCMSYAEGHAVLLEHAKSHIGYDKVQQICNAIASVHWSPLDQQSDDVHASLNIERSSGPSSRADDPSSYDMRLSLNAQ